MRRPFRSAAKRSSSRCSSAVPALILGLVTGLIISIFQATTQIQEPTLTFIPKIVVVGLAILLFGPFMLALLDRLHEPGLQLKYRST